MSTIFSLRTRRAATTVSGNRELRRRFPPAPLYDSRFITPIAGSIQTDRSMVGLVFAKQTPERLMKTRAVSNVFFEIPANADHHKVTASWKPSLDVTLYSLMPHMHYRGSAMEYKVFYPDGKSEVLLNVPAYSFNWQMAY